MTGIVEGSGDFTRMRPPRGLRLRAALGRLSTGGWSSISDKKTANQQVAIHEFPLKNL
jgi:hypothetical protein